MGEYLAKGLATLKERHRCIKEVRGMGLLQGMELDVDGKNGCRRLSDARVIDQLRLESGCCVSCLRSS